MKIISIAYLAMVSMIVGTILIGFATGSIAFGQSVESPESRETVSISEEFLDLFVKELIGITAGALGLGVTAVIQWLRKQGIPVTTEQEAMFREIVTKRFEMLGKESW